jgi:hypothetical protein
MSFLFQKRLLRPAKNLLSRASLTPNSYFRTLLRYFRDWQEAKRLSSISGLHAWFGTRPGCPLSRT